MGNIAATFWMNWDLAGIATNEQLDALGDYQTKMAKIIQEIAGRPLEVETMLSDDRKSSTATYYIR